MGLSTLDTAVVVAYAVGIFLLAQWVSREKAGHSKTSEDYFLASRNLPWWAIGASLIAANISAEQIIGMSGSGYAIGLAVAAYEWMAAITLILVGKYLLPIFLKNNISTMPQFLEQRYGAGVRTVMAVFWLGVYVFVNLASILWLGSLAAHTVTGMDQRAALWAIAAFALLYQIYGGLKAVALTDIVQVTLLVLGGLVIVAISLDRISGGAGVIEGFAALLERAPEKFDLILAREHPYYSDIPGIAVLVGGLWVMNVSYWGFNQYIIQRALAARSLGEAQKGIVFAAVLKLLMPVIVVVPGIAAALLTPGLAKPDEAYPEMMRLLPPGLLGLVFAALIAAVVASLASKINSVATIFTLDLYAHWAPKSDQKRRVLVGRLTALVAVVLGAATAEPLLGKFDQGFQYIQEFTGFFTPGICAIFLLGMFWKRATGVAAMAAAIGSAVLSFALKVGLPDMPFMDRVGLVFLLCVALMVATSLVTRPDAARAVDLSGVSFATPPAFNVAGAAVTLVVAALYVTWW